MKKNNFLRKAILFTLLAVLAISVMAFAVSASEYTAYYYVDGANGSDKADGLSPQTAVKTFSSACRKAAKESGTVAIVITNEYSLSGGINEPIAHENLFVITTKDDTTDYGKDGAKITLGKL